MCRYSACAIVSDSLYSDQLRMVVMNSVFLDGYSAVCGIYEIIEEIIVAVFIGYPEFFCRYFNARIP